MDTQKLCACDRTCQSPISADIDFVDTVEQPFAALVKTLSAVDKNGLWLNPFRGIPRGSILFRHDVIYLNRNCQVLAFAENFTEAEYKPFKGEVASALVLPAHTIKSFRIQKADQLKICMGDEVLAPSESLLGTLHDGSQCVKVPGLQTSLPTSKYGLSAEKAKKQSLKSRVLRWIDQVLSSDDRRKGARFPAPSLVAYYWTGGAPKAYQLGNVSASGLYILTEERWIPGTRILMTLQKKTDCEDGTADFRRAESAVVRWGDDGVGCEFVKSGFVHLNTEEGGKFDQKAFVQFLSSAQEFNPSAQDPALTH